MTDGLLDHMANLADLSDEGLATEAVLVVGFLDEDGNTAFRLVTAGDCTVSTLVGLLTMAQHSLMHDANPTPCETEEDDQ
jgi:hypothetical protein